MTIINRVSFDENLARKSLTVLEKGEWSHRQRVLYEQIYGKREAHRPNSADSAELSWSASLAQETGEDRKRVDFKDGNQKAESA